MVKICSLLKTPLPWLPWPLDAAGCWFHPRCGQEVGLGPRGSPLPRLCVLQTYHSLWSFVVASELLSLMQGRGLISIWTGVNLGDSGTPCGEPWQSMWPCFLQTVPGGCMLGCDPPAFHAQCCFLLVSTSNLGVLSGAHWAWSWSGTACHMPPPFTEQVRLLWEGNHF